VTAENFKQEIAEAMKAYEKYVICIDKTPDEFEASLSSLFKAINLTAGDPTFATVSHWTAILPSFKPE
jgi:hypothetical protein